MFLRHSFCLEGAEISSLTGVRISLAGIQPVLAGFQLPDHDSIGYSQMKWSLRVELQGNRFSCCIKDSQAERLPYKRLAERSETHSTSRAARIPRFVAR